MMDASSSRTGHPKGQRLILRGNSRLSYYFIDFPLQFISSLAAQGLNLLRPTAPQFIPALVCLFFVPLSIFFSVSAGWVVWRSVAVGWDSSIYLQYGDGVPPYAHVPLPILVTQQPYDISLHMEVPATESNFALGNFMTSLTLSTSSNKTLTSIRRPSIARPASRRGITSVLRGRPETVSLDVPLLSSFIPGTSNVIATVELGRRDSWRSVGNGEGRELTVWKASIRGIVRPHGIRGLVTRFPLLSAVVSAFIFLSVSLLTLAAFVLPMMQWAPAGSIEGPPSDISSPKLPTLPPVRRSPIHDSDSGDSGDEKLLRRRIRSRSSRRSKSSSRIRKSVKIEDAEAPSTIIPSADPSPRDITPIRRRRSEKFSDSDT